jgi:hypothetical protein
VDQRFPLGLAMEEEDEAVTFLFRDVLLDPTAG